MKKYICLFLISIMLTVLCFGCGKSDKALQNPTQIPKSTSGQSYAEESPATEKPAATPADVWKDSKASEILPKPDFGTVSMTQTEGLQTIVMIDDATQEAFDGYAKTLTEKGFSGEYDSAANCWTLSSENYKVILNFEGITMTVMLIEGKSAEA